MTSFGNKTSTDSSAQGAPRTRRYQTFPVVTIYDAYNSTRSKEIIIAVTQDTWALQFLPCSATTTERIQGKSILLFQDALLALLCEKNDTQIAHCLDSLSRQFSSQDPRFHIIYETCKHCALLREQYSEYTYAMRALLREPISLPVESKHFTRLGNKQSFLCALSTLSVDRIIISNYMKRLDATRISRENLLDTEARGTSILSRFQGKHSLLDKPINFDRLKEVTYPLPPVAATPKYVIYAADIEHRHLKEIALQYAYDLLSGDAAEHLAAILEKDSDPNIDPIFGMIKEEVIYIKTNYLPRFKDMDDARRQISMDVKSGAIEAYRIANISEEEIERLVNPTLTQEEEFDIEEVIAALFKDF